MNILLVIGILLVGLFIKLLNVLVTRAMHRFVPGQLMNVLGSSSSSAKTTPKGKIKYQYMGSSGSWQNAHSGPMTSSMNISSTLDRLAMQSPRGRSRAVDASSGTLIDMR